tara:strand:+ start:138 stop:266 length:129 start_codon:yes stop_codon:yes gene_type:complete
MKIEPDEIFAALAALFFLVIGVALASGYLVGLTLKKRKENRR